MYEYRVILYDAYCPSALHYYIVFMNKLIHRHSPATKPTELSYPLSLSLSHRGNDTCFRPPRDDYVAWPLTESKFARTGGSLWWLVPIPKIQIAAVGVEWNGDRRAV